MANIIIYDKDGLVTAYRESVNTPDFPDALVVKDRPRTELKFLKVIDGKLTEFTQKEKDELIARELKVIADAEKVFTDKIDALKDLNDVKNYLKTLRLQWL